MAGHFAHGQFGQAAIHASNVGRIDTRQCGQVQVRVIFPAEGGASVRV